MIVRIDFARDGKGEIGRKARKHDRRSQGHDGGDSEPQDQQLHVAEREPRGDDHDRVHDGGGHHKCDGKLLSPGERQPMGEWAGATVAHRKKQPGAGARNDTRYRILHGRGGKHSFEIGPGDDGDEHPCQQERRRFKDEGEKDGCEFTHERSPKAA